MKRNTKIIAEAGVNHNGDPAIAKALVDAAIDAGADIVKFQTFSADLLTTKVAKRANYQIEGDDENQLQYDMLSKLELSEEIYLELAEYCRARNIEFLSTAFDIKSLKFLNKLGLMRIKIPSGEITNLPYLRHAGSINRPIILSTGMATMEEVNDAISILVASGTSRDKLTVLHCTTEYPAPINEVNLLAMTEIQKQLNVAVGYSDHTMGIDISIAAVALGARIIEKHLTLDRNFPGPDHKSSLEPKEFSSMVTAIRRIELALGNGKKLPTPSELKNISHARKSIVALRSIKKGELFGEDNITVKRPGGGISPMLWDIVIGRRSPKNFCKDDLICL